MQADLPYRAGRSPRVRAHAIRWLWRPLIPVFAPRQPHEHLFAALHHSRRSHFGSLNEIVFGGYVPALADAVRTPVAVLHGARDSSAPVGRARELAARQGWDMRIAPTANHQVIIERPELVARWVRTRLLGRPRAED